MLSTRDVGKEGVAFLSSSGTVSLLLTAWLANEKRTGIWPRALFCWLARVCRLDATREEISVQFSPRSGDDNEKGKTTSSAR